ncbi:23S rRNA (pseudouridine(1915)-N(3))-methyltransferase RlmH [Caminibacter mediatlanticus TB-2]|uniref:Ribosomal RNA large subunit methyltransferase H n=1 Tax=Caminibacter mediatlanticus TB-2 TaxID=391592 RepID=A0ABX5V9S7_9BACT|nr:23S rRNA (pseudouridine(1915)-N(3))-methyltransferase RlmH [Caminibacter mediatlanticus]QCT93810.1 23S rRNA (pseudouridine(1915)-N(3))-methyltransferase RlmH [Caminibacter mediatlanticus TB-2]
MQINVFSIEKKRDFQKEIEEFIKKSKPFANVKDITLYSNKLSKTKNPQKEYTNIFEKYTNSGKNIILTPDGKLIDSYEFAKLLNENQINFFIGGAYGFEEVFKKKGINISLSLLTMSHKVAKLVLFEQIYRALTIKNNHPYHK